MAAAEVLASKTGSAGLFLIAYPGHCQWYFSTVRAVGDGAVGRCPAFHRLAHGMAELNEQYQALFHGTNIAGDAGFLRIGSTSVV